MNMLLVSIYTAKFPTTFSVYDGIIFCSFGQQEVVFHFASGCHNFKWKEALSWSLILVFFPNPPEKNRLWWVASRCLIHRFQFIDVWPSWCSKGCLRDPFLKIETYHTLHLDENSFLDVDRNISVPIFLWFESRSLFARSFLCPPATC